MASSALFVVAGYVINVALGRALGPIDYGLFGVVIGLMTVINSLQVSAVPQAVAKFVAERTHRPGDLLLTGGVLQVATSVVLALALFFLAGPLARLFGDDRLAEGFRIAALAFPPYAILTLLLGFQGGRGRYLRQALMLSTYSVSKAVLAIGLGLLFAVPGTIVGYVVAPVVGIVTAGAIDLRGARLVSLRPLLAYSLPLLLLATLSMAYLNIDLFLVKYLVADPATAGYYAAAQNIARMPYFLTAGLAIVLLPAVARAGAGATHDARALVAEALRFGVLLVAPLATLIMAGADDLVVLLYSQRYEPATTALTLLGPAIGAFALVTLLATLLAGVSRTPYAILAVAGGLAVSGVVAVVAIPTMGMAGAAGATLSGAIVALSIAIAAAVSAFSVRVPWLSIVRAGAASTVVGVIALLLEGTAAIVVGLPALVLVYGALLILMRELGPGDWQRVLAFRPDGFPRWSRR